jgi:hypothetical protein
MPENLLQLVLALICLVAFHVDLGVSTTVRVVHKKGGVALNSLAGGVYVRPGASCFRPFRGERASAPTPSSPPESLPEVPGLPFFVLPPQGYFEGRSLIGLLYFLFGLNCDIRREGIPKTAFWEILRDFDNLAIIRTLFQRDKKKQAYQAPSHQCG